MNSNKLRESFLKFFEKNGHKIVASSSLIPKDPSVLLTTAGMQQFKEYFLEEPSPYGNKVVSCQKSFRTSDIDKIGDETHLTFFEMLGNFSFGDYFKEEAIKLAFSFLFEELKLNRDECYFTVFKGDKELPFDEESFSILKKIGIPENKIKKMPREENFWGPTGLDGPCGPTVEIYYKDLEIWNLVFNEYFKDKNGKLSSLKQKGVDTGLGLERLAKAIQNKPSIFETDLFKPIMKEIPSQNERAKRIISDHIKSCTFLISENVLPSNKDRGYILRRLIRRIIGLEKILGLPNNFSIGLVPKVVETYQDIYTELKSQEADIMTVIQNEGEKFEKTLEKGLKRLEKISARGNISGLDAFHLYDTYAFPLELTVSVAETKGLKVDREGFRKAFEAHQKISRAGVEKKFGGLSKDVGEKEIKLHTATHLLHQALRVVLGEYVKQMGSDITVDRLRFDFSHSQKMSQEEVSKVEDLVNQKIKENLKIVKQEMSYEKAIKSGALALGKEDKSSFSPSLPLRGNSVFKDKYPEKVNVYHINGFSKEICGGPHVKNTSELGVFKIIKQESLGAGVRRIRAVLE